MEENEFDDFSFDDFLHRDALQELNLGDLSEVNDIGETGTGREILIQEKTIPSLAKVVSVADRDNRHVSIVECEMAEVRIVSANINMSVIDSLFTQKVDFTNWVCRGSLNIWNVSFGEEADFGKAVFSEDVRFEGCTFHKDVSFAGAVFDKGASFTYCEFEGQVVFDSANFAGHVNLSGSVFVERMSCRGALFRKAVDLSDVRFGKPPDMTDSNLPDMKKDTWAEQPTQKKPSPKRVTKKSEFNPWNELDKASKKTMSRRELLRGVFRFLPEKNEK